VEGKTRKQAREAARAFLPNCTETKIVVTANIQAWRNFIQQRGGASADAEIRELAVAVAKIMKENCPSAFQDLVLDTLPDGREVAVF
jgi:thymidylate synthase (FAD)